jgi:hypothetical protein
MREDAAQENVDDMCVCVCVCVCVMLLPPPVFALGPLLGGAGASTAA